jgi:hypothetical protein
MGNRMSPEYYAAYYQEHKESYLKRSREQYLRSPEGFLRSYGQVRRLEIKKVVLAHYGPDGRLQCSWDGCQVVDLDMLTLDHVDDNGALDLRGTGNKLYQRLKRENFPAGFQTLCCNHQNKKELVRRRTLRQVGSPAPMNQKRNKEKFRHTGETKWYSQP